MGLMTTVAVVGGALIGGVIVHLAAHDIAASARSFAAKLIGLAVKTLPKDSRSRYREEWLADLNDREGLLSKLLHAMGCFICARKVARIRHDAEPVSIEFTIQGETVKTDMATGIMAVDLMKGLIDLFEENNVPPPQPEQMERIKAAMKKEVKVSAIGTPELRAGCRHRDKSH